MCANYMQNRAQMKESECAKDILKCANEKRRTRLLLGNSLILADIVRHKYYLRT